MSQIVYGEVETRENLAGEILKDGFAKYSLNFRARLCFRLRHVYIENGNIIDRINVSRITLLS